MNHVRCLSLNLTEIKAKKISKQVCNDDFYKKFDLNYENISKQILF